MESEKMSETKLLYRPNEAQKALGIGHSTFWKLVKSQAIETKKIGSATVVPAASLQAFIDGLPKTNAA
jgi:predicted DNA-binding transcriptional regulator AlpA